MSSPAELVARISRLVGELEALAKTAADVATIQRTIEQLEELSRNDLKLCVQSWRTRRDDQLKQHSGPVALGDGRSLRSKPVFKDRWDHDLIASRVAVRAVYTPDGERIDDPQAAADRAVELMRAVYVVPSTEPRTEGVLALGFETKLAVASAHEKVGFEVKVIVPKEADAPTVPHPAGD